MFGDEVWHRDHPISDEGVLQSQQLREKIRQARPLGVCGMGTAANCHRLFKQNINCWIPTLGGNMLIIWSNFLVSWWHLHLLKSDVLGAMAQNASTSTTRT